MGGRYPIGLNFKIVSSKDQSVLKFEQKVKIVIFAHKKGPRGSGTVYSPTLVCRGSVRSGVDGIPSGDERLPDGMIMMDCADDGWMDWKRA